MTRKESARPLQAVVQPAAAAAAAEEGRRRRYAPAAADGGDGAEAKVEFRRVNVPQHRMAPLKESWLEIYEPVTKMMRLDMRMNLKTRKVEIKTLSAARAAAAAAAGPSGATGLVIDSSGALQRAADFVHAFILGFSVQDAIALLRMDDLYIEKFEIKDVKVSAVACAPVAAVRLPASEFLTRPPPPPPPRRRADAERGAPGPVHRPHRRQERQDEVHDRERDQDAHRARRHAHLHPRILREHQGGARRHLLAHPRQPGGQGVHQAEKRRGADGRGLRRAPGPPPPAAARTRACV